MYSQIDICLAVLGAFWLGACVGVVIGGINRAGKRAEAAMVFHVPPAHREFEHEADGHYPRQYE